MSAVIDSLAAQQMAYARALWRFEHLTRFRVWHGAVAGLNIVLHGGVWWQLARHSTGVWLLLTPVWWWLALYLADLLNGCVHLWMDHNAAYHRPWGPLVAAFHVHHRTPHYTEKPLWRVYVGEAGSKVWLVGYQIGILWLSPDEASRWTGVWLIGAWIVPLSLWAEVSHFICHNRPSKSWRWAIRLGLALPKAHHAQHHARDNMNYCFLNGWADAWLNRFAQRFCTGYQQGTDLHYQGCVLQLNGVSEAQYVPMPIARRPYQNWR